LKRSEALAPLSRDHHVALEAALRLTRVTAEDLEDGLARFRDFLDERGERHFEIEEEVILPAIEHDNELAALASRVRAEHEQIRRGARDLEGTPAPDDVVSVAHDVGRLLHDHVRFEERELFVLIEARLDPEQLEKLGHAVERAEETPR